MVTTGNKDRGEFPDNIKIEIKLFNKDEFITSTRFQR